MISVPFGTGDIADAMISASQMIYASGVEVKVLYDDIGFIVSKLTL